MKVPRAYGNSRFLKRVVAFRRVMRSLSLSLMGKKIIVATAALWFPITIRQDKKTLQAKWSRREISPKRWLIRAMNLRVFQIITIVKKAPVFSLREFHERGLCKVFPRKLITRKIIHLKASNKVAMVGSQTPP